jgi:GntR family transcriptional regulator
MLDIQDSEQLERGQGRQPLYAALSDRLIKDIASGKYEVNSTLPTEQELSVRYAVSRQTVRQALRVLKEQGMISSHPGIGTIVKAQSADPEKFRAVNSTSDLLQFVGGTEMHAVSLREVQLTPELALSLSCKPGQLMSEVAFLRRSPKSDLPISYVLIYVSPLYAEAQVTPTVSNTPVYQRMEKLFGIKVHEIQQDVTATLLTAEVAAYLEAKEGEAALKITRYFYDINQTMVQVSVSLYPASRYTQSARFRATGISTP